MLEISSRIYQQQQPDSARQKGSQKDKNSMQNSLIKIVKTMHLETMHMHINELKYENIKYIIIKNLSLLYQNLHKHRQFC